MQKQQTDQKTACTLLTATFELPTLSLRLSALLCGIIGLLFLCVGLPMMVVMLKIIQHKSLYYNPDQQDACKTGTECSIDVSIGQKMNGPVYLLYELNNFYQNNRKYIQSKSNYQLAGNTLQSYSKGQICKPYISNEQMNKFASWGNHSLNGSSIASPCGSIAYTYFTDTFSINNQHNHTITIREEGITWQGQQGKKYRRGQNSEQVQWIDPQNEHFIVWMQASGLPNFRKLWGVIDDGLEVGNYTIYISNNYNSSNWEGKRYIILTQNSTFGGKNYIIPLFLITSGVFCFFAGFALLKKRSEVMKEREQGQ